MFLSTVTNEQITLLLIHEIMLATTLYDSMVQMRHDLVNYVRFFFFHVYISLLLPTDSVVQYRNKLSSSTGARLKKISFAENIKGNCCICMS